MTIEPSLTTVVPVGRTIVTGDALLVVNEFASLTASRSVGQLVVQAVIVELSAVPVTVIVVVAASAMVARDTTTNTTKARLSANVTSRRPLIRTSIVATAGLSPARGEDPLEGNDDY